MLGNSADEISLYRQSGTTRTRIIDGVDGRLNLSASSTKVKVTRDASGNWELFSDVALTGTYTSEGIALRCHSSFLNLLWIVLQLHRHTVR